MRCCWISSGGTDHRRPTPCKANLTSPQGVKQTELRRMRQESGLSQAALGDQLNVSRQTVIAIETGRYDPSLKLAMRIARVFGVTVEEMFDDGEHDA